MNCHQILSGACNAGDRCFAVGSVEGIPFTAYAAGCNIVILASTFERVQIIPGAIHNYVRISCVDCSTDTGKIAAAYENQVCIFEPTPLIHNNSAHQLDYRWVQTGSWQTESHISSLSWNLEGTRLLTGGEILQLWHQHISPNLLEDDTEMGGGGGGVTFEIGEEAGETTGCSKGPPSLPPGADEEDRGWECVWKCHTATPILHMAFSPDGTLFATAGRNDRLVKIWFENKQLLFPSKTVEHSQSVSLCQPNSTELNYGFVYISHPRAVTQLSWRKTSKYMPKGSVSNMLVTSCRDNICRIWVETVLPDDGLVNMHQFDPLAAHNPKFRTHRHKHRFMQRLKHMKTCFHIRRHAKHQQNQSTGPVPIPTLPSTYSVHDFHSYGFHGTGVTPGLHFHLAASINAETDIPLVPSLVTGDPEREPNFVLHWLNNKEMHFSLQAEAILHELTRKVVEKEEGLGLDTSNPDSSEHHDSQHDDHNPGKKKGSSKIAKSLSQDESGSDEHHAASSFPSSSHQTLSNATSINSLATDTGPTVGHVPDSLDTKIECLLRDWHHSPDLLFAIHPIDGSFLIWVVEWLDEYHPGSFRQAQVSFSTRIPSAFPLGDATTMSNNVCLYHTSGCHLQLVFRDVVKTAAAATIKTTSSPAGPGSDAGGEPTTPLPSVIEEDADDDANRDTGEDGGGSGEGKMDQMTGQRAGSSAGESGHSSGVGGVGSSFNDILSAPPSPTLSMVTKHSNGTLNLWQLTFADKTKFSQVLSIGHASRASGHRFRVNDITCHPVLPLLLSTSHHNLPEGTSNSPSSPSPQDPTAPVGFCSELILWRVDAVGPLSKSGGVSELARINSPQISAFSNVAWIPTLLPSTTLGNLSNSPSACFVASDGESLRVYQAVIDARTLLAEVSSSERRSRIMGSLVSLSTDLSSEDGVKHSSLHDRIKIVSQQSTARPGCVIQLDAISDATHDWQNTQFLHVFQEQLITGIRGDEHLRASSVGGELSLMEAQLSAIVDLHHSAEFEEPFYLVVLERTTQGTTIHMWRLVIASQSDSDELSGSMMYVPDSHLVQDDDDLESSGRAAGTIEDEAQALVHPPHVTITTTKVCTQELPLPDGVDVIHASPAGGHLSSASIYPACFAPYIIVTACSDSTVRFWKCIVDKEEQQNNQGQNVTSFKYHWAEWEMLRKDKESMIDVPGQPLNISAAYSGRIACAYKYGKSFTRPSRKDPDSRYVNLCVAIYECESTGGSEWVLEDTLYLKNIHLPRIQVDPSVDLSYLYDQTFLSKKQRLQTNFIKAISSEDLDARTPHRNGEHNGTSDNNLVKSGAVFGSTKNTRELELMYKDDNFLTVPQWLPMGGQQQQHLELPAEKCLLAVPSFSTLQSLRRSITENGNTCPLTQKHLVQLDWVSKEDGSHILTVAVGSKVMLFTPVSSDLAQANMKAMKESQSTNRPILRKASSLAAPNFVDEIRWMKLRRIDLQTADGLPPLPMQISWVRDGILVVGMDSEMHVYSQWKPDSIRSKSYSTRLPHQESDEMQDTRNLRDEDLRNLAQESSQRRLANVSSMPHLSRVSSINLTMMSVECKKKRTTSTSGTGGNNTVQSEPVSNMDSYMPDYGLFEASRIACPVLPQYHPKQLMELLNSGKIRWVKAILAHLVRCISGTCSVRQGAVVCSFSDEDNLTRQRGWSRSRTLSVSYAAGTSSPLEQRGSTTAIPEELMLDYAEITSIPPLPLWTLLAADKETLTKPQGADDQKDYNELFDGNVSAGDVTLDDLLDDDEPDSPLKRERRQSSNAEKQSTLSHFGPRQGRLLSRLLTHTHLPGLSSLDQMHLLALADTVSTCNTDFAERFVIDAAKTAIAKENLTGTPEGDPASSDSLDDCGLRFLLAMKHYNYLLRCLPLVQRAKFQKQGISTNNLVWAFHSESEEELLQLIPSYAKGNPKWSQLKELGVGWWLRNHTLLKTCIEKVAKAAYKANQDPLDAAIFYLAMKKKSLVWGLYRSSRDERMTSFFANDFSEDRWRKAALKNAFALLGKQRFEHAAAFFMLAGALRDAIEVCLNKLDDLQLAMVIARLYEGEMDSTPPNVKRLLHEEILGCDAKGDNQSMSQVHPDPFLRSMALWILKDFTGSLNTLLQTNVGTMHAQYNNDDDRQEGSTANPNVFNFYVYLRTHPLLIRQYLASTYQDKKKHTVVLSGFSYGSDSKTNTSDRQLLLEDSITPLERQLYFTTAHAHFKAGCPALALEVLSKLPTKVMEDTTSVIANSPSKNRVQDTCIDTGILSWDDQTSPSFQTKNEKPKGEDTSSSLMNGGSSLDFDWSQPVPKKDDELVLNWEDDEEKKSEDEDGSLKETSEDKPIGMKIDKQESVESNTSKNGQNGCQMDIMAQQLKFVACLKILMEELSTLATGYEVDGGQLRYQLYLWLEREVDALRQLCNYSAGDVDPTDPSYEGIGDVTQEIREYTNTPTFNKDKPTLHEILMAEKSDFEAKVQRAAKRKKWLKANETLLRTLLSYCSLHGASGGGLASVRMELVLLLQELQQEKTQQQLLSPLPFPTTLPLLSASVACNKTVVADPVRLLQALTHDMLQTIIEMRSPPSLTRVNLSEVFVLRDLSVALSACIYQSLCDSDSCSVKQSSECYQGIGPENLSFVNASSHLIATQHRKRRYSTDEPLQVTTLPLKWPGVTNLRALLAREKDEDTPRLNVLLCEAFVGAYMSLVVYAIATCDCHILYRLAGQQFSNGTWATLFGGGVKKLLRVATSTSSPQSSIAQGSIDQDSGVVSSDAGVWTAVTSLTKQRVRLNMKLLGQFGSQPGTPTIKEDKPTYREQFVPPEMSMVSYFLNKPHLTEEAQEVDYDSADSAVSDLSDEEEEDVFEGDTSKDKSCSGLGGSQRENTEHSNPSSYSWCVMRLAIMRLCQGQLQDFLNTAGIELQELPVSSPLIHGVLRVVSQWSEVLREELEMRGPPPSDYIPGCYVETSAPGPPIHKYRSLLDKGNTPFHPRHWSAAPARRLWSFLVRQEPVQDLFIRCVFGKRRTGSVLDTVSINGDDKPSTDPAQNLPEPVRIIHKEQDSISAFCLNQVNGSYLALATPREVQEMDISLLLELPSWLEDECEFDIINLNKEPEQLPASGFLVIQTACDKPLISQPPGTINLQNNSTSPQPGIAGQTGRGASVKSPSSGGDSVSSGVAVSSGKGVRVNKNPSVLKHKVDGIRRISAHPLLPLYLTGSQDGSVQMWEWGHQQAVTLARPAGTFAKVTRVRFSQHGNKFGVADGDGNLSLFQVGLASTVSRPFFTYQCHNKVTSDFVFLGSCSLVATAGHSSESKNVALWDTLLPQKKSLIAAFTCHDQGASSLVFAPQHQLLISAGKKGDVCILDVRQRQMRHRFMAHESPVKCLAIDPAEEFFATGAADGDIKVWGLTIHHLLFSFPGEHARSSFFKHIGQGVTQLHIDAAARLFSCGADGSMKVRQLPERDLTLHTLY